MDRKPVKTQEALQKLKTEVSQLKQESKLPREPVSRRGSELVQFVLENQNNDALVYGMMRGNNPFKTKSQCSCL